MTEIWKDISESNGVYQVSNLGRVRISETGRLLKLSYGAKGYRVVSLVRGVKKVKRVHRLVAQAFIENTGGKPEVNHKDGNKSNNCVSNLEWVTTSENNIHAVYTGLAYPRLGIKPVICVNTGKAYPSISIASKILGLSYGAISEICQGKRGPTHGMTFVYADKSGQRLSQPAEED